MVYTTRCVGVSTDGLLTSLVYRCSQGLLLFSLHWQPSVCKHFFLARIVDVDIFHCFQIETTILWVIHLVKCKVEWNEVIPGVQSCFKNCFPELPCVGYNFLFLDLSIFIFEFCVREFGHFSWNATMCVVCNEVAPVCHSSLTWKQPINM